MGTAQIHEISRMTFEPRDTQIRPVVDPENRPVLERLQDVDGCVGTVVPRAPLCQRCCRFHLMTCGASDLLILSFDGKGIAAKRPRPTHKRVWASIEHAPQEVINDAFAEPCAALLRLRSAHSGDSDDYWGFHLAKEHERTHAAMPIGEFPTRFLPRVRTSHWRSDRSSSVERVVKVLHPFQMMQLGVNGRARTSEGGSVTDSGPQQRLRVEPCSTSTTRVSRDYSA